MSQLSPSEALGTEYEGGCALRLQTVQRQTTGPKGAALVALLLGKRECIWRDMRDHAFGLTRRPHCLTERQQEITAF